MFSTKIRTTVAALAAAATLMTLGVAAAPADAVAAAPADAAIGSLTAQLSMSRSGSYLYNVNVSGTVPMTQAEARSLIGSGHKVVYRLWGDDPVSDDFLWGPVDTELVSTPLGLQFTGLGLTLNRSFLNEDNDLPDYRDEIYAGVRLVDSRGATVRSRETNRVGGYL
jgi:hypothetical protein